VAAALGHAVDRIWIGIVGARVDLEAVAPALAILPRARTQVAQHSLALANLELGDLAKFRGVALASAAGEIIQDAAARAVDGIGAAGLHQAQFVERLMRQEWRAGGGFRRSACDCKNGQRSKRSPEQSIHETYLWMTKICQINDGPIASQLGPLH